MFKKPYLIIVPLLVAVFVAVIIIDKNRRGVSVSGESSGFSAEPRVSDFPANDGEATARSARHKERESQAALKKIRTASGLIYQVLKEGDGAKPGATDKVKVIYQGYLPDGTEFDRSPGGKPVSFRLNGVIPGWSEGLQLMRVGGSYRFTIPPELAYGARGAGTIIGPNQTLVFDVELLSVEE